MDITEKLDSLATKDDLILLFKTWSQDIKDDITRDFDEKLRERDERIAELERKLQDRPQVQVKLPVPPIITVGDDEWETGADDKEEVDFIDIGDSIIKYADPTEIAPDASSSEHICMRGAKIEQVGKRLEDVLKEKKVNKVVLHVGTNNIPKDRPEVVASKVLTVLNSAKTAHPDTEFYYSLILPKIGPNHLPGINMINSIITQNQEKIGFKVIPHPQFCKKGVFNLSLFSYPEVLNRKPVHLSRKGNKLFAENIKSCISKL